VREDTGGFMLLALTSAPMVVQLRNRDAIDLARLRAWADEWDDEADGACWPARRFVAWVERNMAGDPARQRKDIEAGQLRRRNAIEARAGG